MEEAATSGSLKDFRRIFQYADRIDWVLNAISFICSIASGSAMPLMAIIFGKFASEFGNFAEGRTQLDQFRRDTTRLALWYLGLFAVKIVLVYIATIGITISGIRTTRTLRQAFLEHILRTEIWYFDTAKRGSYVTQVTTSATRINQGIAEKLVFVIQALAMFVSSFLVAIFVQWRLTLITMSVIPIMFLVMAICMKYEVQLESQITRPCSNAAALAQEAFSSIRTVHVFWAQEVMTSRYEKYLSEAYHHGKKKSVIYGVLGGITNFCVYSGNGLAFWKGYQMFQTGEIQDIGQVLTVVLSVMMASSALSMLFPQLTAITNAAAAASELFQFMDKPSKLDPLSHIGYKPRTCHGAIELQHVNFAYPSRPETQVLRDFSISIPAGKTTALVGASGGGKSTIIGLLERWYEPISGKITIDGIDISKLNIKWLRTQIGLVEQDATIFRGTVFMNVAKGLTDDQKNLSHGEQLSLVQTACEASYAHDFIQSLPLGYDTYLNDSAGSLSGGQRQRIAIARSLVSNPAILLLDEATSALDARAEMLVQQALSRISKNCTTIVIAHRLSTIRNADNIVVVSQGKVTEQGTHEELLAVDGHYSQFVKAQGLENDEEHVAVTHAEGSEYTPSDSGSNDSTQPLLIANGSRKPMTSEDCDMNPESQSLAIALLQLLWEQKPLYPTMGALVFFCCMAAGTYPIQALLLSKVIHTFSEESSPQKDKIGILSLMFFGIALGNLVAYFFTGSLSNLISQKVTYLYRLELFQRLINMDIEFFDRLENASGALTAALTGVPSSIQELISVNIFVMLIMALSTVASSCLALAWGWKLALIMIFAGLPLLLTSGYIRVRLETDLNNRNDTRFTESAALAAEAVAALRTVASLTSEHDILAEYASALEDIVRHSIMSLSLALIPYAFSQSVDFLVMALGFWYGARLISSGEYTADQFFVIFTSVLFAGQAAAQFFTVSGSIARARSAATYLFRMRQETLSRQLRENSRITDPDGGQGLSFSNVKFRYPRRQMNALSGISLNIDAGQFVAFVGHSGCGKSTLISLIERFYDSDSGDIRIGGQNILESSLRRHRSSMALVQQDTVLYQGTIRENIALGAGMEVTNVMIEEAARQAGALDFIMSLPFGFNTDCGSRGLSLSGGQRQRIAIARALIRNPKILLLDEATSALDSQSEAVVQAALERASQKRDRITIAVAHRLSTIRNADTIYVLADGRIVESGDHDQLLRMKGLYFQTYMAQLLA
ncbi:hypothetical protein ASPVEDRAFT_156125 [Aspergillus versicolor CBS 583.65]|uniref:Uncharacterized protein n=1 Tax=Aspergillus versicolor CBS 583.65 TaxID=1036611 RepID=A0A1L9Q3Z4_ASPVE|nr:uncharacterized protein ASPVEDRAFT_156125 [Aspergillus versicolor CBS 583.65]OJJ08481.1 hypothetical protein ASPVEDRAFT_156125 [Aspergillus versicolor CBS 583.65]